MFCVWWGWQGEEVLAGGGPLVRGLGLIVEASCRAIGSVGFLIPAAFEFDRCSSGLNRQDRKTCNFVACSGVVVACGTSLLGKFLATAVLSKNSPSLP